MEQGWHEDPSADGKLRFWNGTSWTDQSAPAGLPPPPTSAPAAVAGRTAPNVDKRQDASRHRGASRSFAFDGGAATYFGTAVLATLITALSLGIAFPFALVLRQRWRAKHTFVDGRQLVFLGTGVGLFGMWIKWLLLMVVTVGIYSFWVIPRVHGWVVENTDFAGPPLT